MPFPFPDKDYISPGLRVVVPDAHFPHMRAGDRLSHPWQYLRREVPHHWYADERFPLMGFMNRDEAIILYNIALQFAGKPALEIGSWLGWSTCHLALAGVMLDVIDPAHADPDFRALVEQSLTGCGVSARVNLVASRSPEGVQELAARSKQSWNLFFIDSDHEGPAPEMDVQACLPYAAPDCAFVFHDLVSPAVAAGLQFLRREGFDVLVYQTQQIMGIAWRGRVTPVAHVPDPEVAWQLPHHLIGLPVSGVDFDADVSHNAPSLSNPSEYDGLTVEAIKECLEKVPTPRRTSPRLLRDVVQESVAVDWRLSVCIVSNEVIGPFKNGGIGTAMTGLAEHLAHSGCRVTILYTGGVWSPDVQLGRWKKRYAKLGIDFVVISIEEMKLLEGPVKDCGFGVPYLVYQYLATKRFDVVHFNDCTGEGNICLVAKKLGLAFQDTLLVVALHSPSQWVLELNHTMPTSLLLSAYNLAEHLSVKCADVVWSPSRYLIDWIRLRGFKLPEQTFVQQYCLPSQRLRESGEGAHDFPAVQYGRTAPPKEIVFFGRLEERKGLRLFCNAIHSLRQELAERNITVTFLGKAETCDGMSSLEYIARRSREWQFPVKTLTNLGQPEALAYLLSGEKLAVIASAVDNSPCTVYEALAWGIPFLAARTGGIPELVREADCDQVLFECTTASLSKSLFSTLDIGAWIAAPSQSQEEIKRVWSSFHRDARRYLTPNKTGRRAPSVVAIIDGQSLTDIQVTLESLAASPAVRHVIVLNRCGESFAPCEMAKFSIRNIDLSKEEAEALDEEIANLTDELILMIHSGIRIRPDSFASMLSSLEAAGIDGLQPAAEVTSGRTRKIVLPLGGDPSFTLFQGATFTGGLLVRAEAFRRARLWRDLAVESNFLGLADFCVTRGIEVWPYPQAVFERPEHWTMDAAKSLPARVMAFDDCSPVDRYYMLAAGYGARGDSAGTSEQAGRHRLTALKMIDLGLLPLVRFASWTRKRMRSIRPRRPLSSIERRLERLLRGNR
jgi:glycosyltransferase involved in cell wall biosynthesis/predicted O-methyltransferase YrrM